MNRLKLSCGWLLVCFLLSFSPCLGANEESDEDIRIKLPKSRGSVYELLNKVSEKSGYLFIYDSQLIDNDKEAKIYAGEYTLQDAIHRITGNNRLNIRILGNHVLLYIPEEEIVAVIPPVQKPPEQKYFVLEGKVLDRITGEPIIFGSVGVSKNSFGTVTNLNGEFKLTLPDSLIQSVINFSHIGYISREIGASLLAGQHIAFYLDQKIIPLQEIVVRVVDPLRTIREMMQKRSRNYSHEPIYQTAFYREGVEYKKGISLSEAVLKIYKSGFTSIIDNDQAKLLKMRKMTNAEENDSLVAKIKSSVNSCLLLDLVKNPPDFLLPDNRDLYDFSHTNLTTIDDRRVYVFSFVQKDNIIDPLYCGDVYIDAENFALLKARFQINPRYIKKISDELILKKGKNLDVIPAMVAYEVEYKPLNGKYYINHIRGDLNFKVRKKRKLFSSDLHIWFEMVNCKTDTSDVKRFSSEERISTRDIFSESSFTYDKDFWGNTNVILPEDKLKELIQSKLFK